MTTLSTKPQWIARMYAGKVGRDHLGLGSVSSDQILPTLSPAINVLTIHPRYHSFYTFLLDEFWRRKRARSLDAWMFFYRPREFIFSVGAYLCEQPEHGQLGTVVGGQKTEPLANQELPAYDTTFNYIKSELGGYGLYYRSVIAQLGLIFPGGRGFPYPVDVPSERGKEVAAAFRKAVRDTTYYRDYFDDDATSVPIKVVKEYIHRACLCQLQLQDAPDRPLLLDIFLHAGSEATARRETFRMLLDICDQTQEYAVEQDAFRQLLYFQAAGNGATYSPRDTVLEVYRKWRLYQAREYYSFALNGLWYHLCAWGIDQSGDVRPIPLSRFWEYLELALDFDGLAARFDLPSSGVGTDADFRALLAWLEGLVGADSDTFDARCTLDAPIHEHRLYELARNGSAAPEIMVAGMMTMLALVYLRFNRRDLALRPEWEISQMGADGRLSVHGFIATLRRKLQSGYITVGEVARWLYADYIILQHQLVANSKLPDNTFRFHREGDQLHFYRLYNRLDFMDSRFDALSRTIYELGLCGDLYEVDHPLTSDGQRLLDEGDLV